MADYEKYIEKYKDIFDYVKDYHTEDLIKILPEELANKGFPMKSFFDNGVNVTSHSDFPATFHSPEDPFGIMEIAVTGVYHVENTKAWETEELITREQAIQALTINVAKQMFLENERGSISTGKFADFLLVTKDVLTCPEKEIHEAKPAATYFEGKKVFSI
jgi:predicted amidohydrolase YtcJ